jgi:CO dehydrogenase/acetyl-CoA synthase delta subunit
MMFMLRNLSSTAEENNMDLSSVVKDPAAAGALLALVEKANALQRQVDELQARFDAATTVATLESAAPVTEAELAAAKASGLPPAEYNAMVRKYNAQIARVNAELSRG